MGYLAVIVLPDPERVHGRRGSANIERCTGAELAHLVAMRDRDCERSLSGVWDGFDCGEVAPVAEDNQPSPPTSESAQPLEDFLATDTARPGEGIVLTGQIAGLLGVVLVLGGMGFMATTLRGTRPEIRMGLVVLRVLGWSSRSVPRSRRVPCQTASGSTRTTSPRHVPSGGLKRVTCPPEARQARARIIGLD